jgi:hypothetical protein
MSRTPSRPDSNEPKAQPVARRGLLAGLGVAAGAAAAAHLASRSIAPPPAEATPLAKAAEGSGYRLTAHVQRYYETTKA